MPRFTVLDSWRGLAACMVALFHLRAPSHVHEAELVRNASLFVDFFFVLSGFVIAASYAERLAAGFGVWRFALLRFGRLYPLHLAVLLAFIGVGGNAVSTPHGSVGFTMHLFLLHGLGIVTPVWGNVPSWSISTEFFVYLAFAAAVSLLRERVVWALAVTLLAAPAIIYAGSDTLAEADGYQLVRGLYGFSVGAMAWSLFRWLRQRVRIGTLWEITAVVILVYFVSLAGSSSASIAAPVVFAAVVLVFAFEGGVASRALTCKPFLFIGAVSYSIYMVHYFVAKRMADGLSFAYSLGIPINAYLGVEKWAGDLAMAIYLALVLIVSGLTYRFIEAPSRAWFRRLAERTESRGAPV